MDRRGAEVILGARDIADATGGRLVREGPRGPIRTDSRRLRPGDWFLALRGERFDAHTFLLQAAAAGCAGAVAEEAPEGWTRGLVIVPDTLRALQDCASWVRDRLGGVVVAITGSAGKTTTRGMVAEILRDRGAVHQTAGNLNNHVGLPLCLLDTPPDAEVVVLEMGMSAPGEIRRLQEIARPGVRLVTNVSAAHTLGAGGLDGVARCKAELFEGAAPGDVLVVNDDDPRVRSMARPAGTRAVLYGSSRGCDVRSIDARVIPGLLRTVLRFEIRGEPYTATLAAPGRHLAADACAALAVGHALGVQGDAMVRALEGWRPLGMRMRVERLPGGVVLLNDAYNANPASMAAALEALGASGAAARVALLGDMLELGDMEGEAHAEIARCAAAMELELLGLVGPRFGRCAEAARRSGARRLLVAGDALAMGPMLPRLAPGTLVLLKGSRGMGMERLVQYIEGEEG